MINLENEYDRLMDLLPPEMQDQFALELEMGTGHGGDPSAQPAPEEKVEEKDEKKGKTIPAFSPVFTDGRFLFGVEAKKPEVVVAAKTGDKKAENGNEEESKNQMNLGGAAMEAQQIQEMVNEEDALLMSSGVLERKQEDGNRHLATCIYMTI